MSDSTIVRSKGDKDKTVRKVRIGFLSRIDYGSDGFRQGLLELAAETFRTDKVDFVVGLGGIVAGKAVEAKTRALGKELREERKAHEKLHKEILSIRHDISDIESESGPRNETERKELLSLQKQLGEKIAAASKLAQVIRAIEGKIKANTPEQMAEDLAERMPSFGKDSEGKPIKLWVVPSTPYDMEVGQKTASYMVDKLGIEKARLLKTDADRMRIWENTPDERILELLTPELQVWLRGNFHSTPIQRRLIDRRRQSSAPRKADFQVVGGVGVSMLKPEGNWPIGFMGLPVLCRLEESRSENQIGVMVLEMSSDRRNATMRSHSFRDLISNERQFIGVPADLSSERQKCIDVLKKEGRCTTGYLAGATKLSAQAVKKALTGIMTTRHHKRRATWPGLTLDEADRWDFDLDWVQSNLRYPRYSGEEKKTDRIVAICCMHAASHDTDYGHFLREVPRVMLAQGADVLVSAGDHVEGTSHGFLEKQEVIAGFNDTKQESLAGWMIAKVLFKVFVVRLAALLKKMDLKKLAGKDIGPLVQQTLPKFRYVPGNHCGWVAYRAITPLKTMVHEIVRNLTMWVGGHLALKGLRADNLMELVQSRVETVSTGQFVLPSGLKQGMTHPHMGGADTISSASQRTLMLYRECPVVFEGNFHTGVVIEEWDSGLGQRICVQLPTFKHGSGFEHSKLKTVDQGFAFAKIHSVAGRIVMTETTFYSNDKATPEEKRLDPDKPYDDFIGYLERISE